MRYEELDLLSSNYSTSSRATDPTNPENEKEVVCLRLTMLLSPTRRDAMRNQAHGLATAPREGSVFIEVARYLILVLQDDLLRLWRDCLSSLES